MSCDYENRKTNSWQSIQTSRTKHKPLDSGVVMKQSIFVSQETCVSLTGIGRAWSWSFMGVSFANEAALFKDKRLNLQQIFESIRVNLPLTNRFITSEFEQVKQPSRQSETILKYTARKKSRTNIMPVHNGLNQLHFLEINNLKFMDYCKP